jgi:nitroimidazol reductase NimA-like FMN-containing flavoprotein (pyridoxamine 5'-phosphate oxidase superfamily)
VPGPKLAKLTREDCLRRLAACSVGRFAVAGPAEPPFVVPVNYILDGDVVVFRTEIGRKLLTVRRAVLASFEVDEIDHFHRTGWSVLVQGAAYEATATEIQGLRVEPWTGGARDRWVRIVPRSITGRTIRIVEPHTDGHGYL